MLGLMLLALNGSSYEHRPEIDDMLPHRDMVRDRPSRHAIFDEYAALYRAVATA